MIQEMTTNHQFVDNPTITGSFWSFFTVKSKAGGSDCFDSEIDPNQFEFWEIVAGKTENTFEKCFKKFSFFPNYLKGKFRLQNEKG